MAKMTFNNDFSPHLPFSAPSPQSPAGSMEFQVVDVVEFVNKPVFTVIDAQEFINKPVFTVKEVFQEFEVTKPVYKVLEVPRIIEVPIPEYSSKALADCFRNLNKDVTELRSQIEKAQQLIPQTSIKQVMPGWAWALITGLIALAASGRHF